MNYRMLRDYVLVRPAAVPDRVGQILVPGMFQHTTQRGTIVAAGVGTLDEKRRFFMLGRFYCHDRVDGSPEPRDIRAGDDILYTPLANVLTVKVDGEKLLVMGALDIMAVLEDVPEGGVFCA
jgi:co-chaperonin GroES (HSP10)